MHARERSLCVKQSTLCLLFQPNTLEREETVSDSVATHLHSIRIFLSTSHCAVLSSPVIDSTVFVVLLVVVVVVFILR